MSSNEKGRQPIIIIINHISRDQNSRLFSFRCGPLGPLHSSNMLPLSAWDTDDEIVRYDSVEMDGGFTHIGLFPVWGVAWSHLSSFANRSGHLSSSSPSYRLGGLVQAGIFRLWLLIIFFLERWFCDFFQGRESEDLRNRNRSDLGQNGFEIRVRHLTACFIILVFFKKYFTWNEILSFFFFDNLHTSDPSNLYPSSFGVGVPEYFFARTVCSPDGIFFSAFFKIRKEVGNVWNVYSPLPLPSFYARA